MEETKEDNIFIFIITWLIFRVPIIFYICYGLYYDFKSLSLSVFAGIMIVLLMIAIDKLMKILEMKS